MARVDASVLVTGAQGFIGSWLVERLLDVGRPGDARSATARPRRGSGAGPRGALRAGRPRPARPRALAPGPERRRGASRVPPSPPRRSSQRQRLPDGDLRRQRPRDLQPARGPRGRWPKTPPTSGRVLLSRVRPPGRRRLHRGLALRPTTPYDVSRPAPTSSRVLTPRPTGCRSRSRVWPTSTEEATSTGRGSSPTRPGAGRAVNAGDRVRRHAGARLPLRRGRGRRLHDHR